MLVGDGRNIARAAVGCLVDDDGTESMPEVAARYCGISISVPAPFSSATVHEPSRIPSLRIS